MIPKNEIIVFIITAILAIITIVNFIMKRTDYIYKNHMFVSTLLKNKKKIKSNKKFYSDFFNVTVFKSSFEEYNFMLIIQPQNYHFFIENNKLIYHQNNRHLDGLLKQYSCDYGFELAYRLPLNNNKNKFPRVVCHKNLKYLKSNIYKPQNIIHYKKFETLQNPINAIKVTLNDIIEFL